MKEFNDYPNVAGLDWHFAVTGLVFGLDEVREREYTVSPGNLLMRPVLLDAAGNDWRAWPVFADLVTRLQTDEAWRDRRNKVKALRDALRAGDQAVRQFRSYYLGGELLPDIPNRPDVRETGWDGARCAYFDAIEAMDFYVPLNDGGQAG
jgi:hypothetical protein